jgi:predicted RNase H-like HicB family nuclease
MESKIREYLRQPYSRILIPDVETGRYAAQILEFSGCNSEGPTPQKAYKNLEQAAYNWLASALKQGLEIPAPFSSDGYSGRVALRLPKSLHRQATNIAHRDGTSLNQFFVSAISAAVGAENLYQKLADRLSATITANAVLEIRWPGQPTTSQWVYVTAGQGKTMMLAKTLHRFSEDSAATAAGELGDISLIGAGQTVQ